MIDKELLTTNEVAKILDKSVNTIYKYVKEKKLRPVYEDSWQIDQTLLFRRKDVEKLRELLKKPGLTTGEVANKLNLHISTVNSYVKKGILHAEKHYHIGLGREVYFVKEEELERFKNNHQSPNDAKKFFIRDGEFYLFQLFNHPTTNEWGRIIELVNDDGKIMTEQGRTLSLSQALNEGFLPTYYVPEHEFIHQKGYAVFQFPKPQHISSPIYNVVDLFYQQYGRKNIRMIVEQEQIHIEVKPKFLELDPDQYHAEFKVLDKHLVDGKILKRHNGIYIDSDLESIVVHVRTAIKEKVKQQAETEGLTMDEYVGKLIKEKVDGTSFV